MRLWPVAVAAASASSILTPTHAQSPRGPAIAAFGACVAAQQQRSARALMAMPLGSREEFELARRLVERSGCIHDRMFLTLQIREVRGTIAEALLKSDPEALAQIAARPSTPAIRTALSAGDAFVGNYARCLTDAEPGKAVRLVGTGPHSEQERDALLDFGDTLNDCMPEGPAYRIDRFGTRIHIAIRLYEMAEQLRTDDPARDPAR